MLNAEMVVQHEVFVPSSGPQARHGQSDEGTYADPIVRKAFQFYPARWQRPVPDPINTEDYDRTVQNMILDTPEPAVYKKRDRVIVDGTAYLVQGRPEAEAWNNGNQLMSQYDSFFGGQILVRRVT